MNSYGSVQYKYNSIKDNEHKMADNKNYWKENISLIIKCLTIWFIVSYGCSIIFVDVLNNIRLGGYKLGFWFAQQGSIYTFVILIFYYVYEIDKIDRRYGVADH